MQALLSETGAVRLLSQKSKSANVVVAYEGIKAGQNAMQAYTRIVHELGADMQFHNTLVSFSLLADPAFALETAKTAARADILIVSTAANTSPPDAVKLWIENWIRTRKPGKAALVGMTGTPSEDNALELPLHGYLGKLAQEAGIPYFQGTSAPSAGPGTWPEAVRAGASTVPPSIDEILDQSQDISRWGINE